MMYFFWVAIIYSGFDNPIKLETKYSLDFFTTLIKVWSNQIKIIALLLFNNQSGYYF
jgi:hypothetical protein